MDFTLPLNASFATSITAFAGWTARGDTDRVTLVQSWAAFERSFGGLFPILKRVK